MSGNDHCNPSLIADNIKALQSILQAHLSSGSSEGTDPSSSNTGGLDFGNGIKTVLLVFFLILCLSSLRRQRPNQRQDSQRIEKPARGLPTDDNHRRGGGGGPAAGGAH